MNNSGQAAERRDGRIVLYGLIGFFLTFMTVDAVMVTLAVRSQTGVVTDHAYEKGLAYNDTIAAAQAAKESGWQGAVTYERGQLEFQLQDDHKIGITGAMVQASLTRPVHDGEDRTFDLQQAEQSGIYRAQMDPILAPGLWVADITVTTPHKIYHHTQQIVVP
jgi:nitrogen fixation protein FixH